MNKKQFIDSILAMNINSLESTLQKDVFKGFSNVTFLEKLTQTFTKLKADGDTHLNLHKGNGICSCNKGRKVFCFVGNKSNNYFTLSYKENKDSYSGFSKSCNEVLYDEVFELNKFYYFSIDPKDTTEYHNLVSAHKPISQYQDFITKGSCKMATIELWLKNHKNLYYNTVELLDDKTQTLNFNRTELLVKKEFKILYGKVKILSKLYIRETYFKKQLKKYKKIRDSISKRKKWFDYQEENKNEYELFSYVFFDNREQTFYNLKIDELVLDRNDFKYTLKFMDILEDNQRKEVVGKIKMIEDLKVFKKSKKGRAYSERKIIISVGKEFHIEYQIIFRDGRTKNLKNLLVGQSVKVLVEFYGGKWDNEYKINLWGWKIEPIKLTNKTIKKRNKDMELYDKAFIIDGLPF